MSDSLLEIRNLTKRYGENTVLRDLCFTVRRGEVIVVLGPSGCGKSTLLRCINALEPIQGGEILLGGEVIDRSPAGLPALRRRIGMVFQSYELFPHMTVMENILLAPCKARGAKKEDAALLMFHAFFLLLCCLGLGIICYCYLTYSLALKVGFKSSKEKDPGKSFSGVF